MKRASLKQRFYAIFIDYTLMGIVVFLTSSFIAKKAFQNFDDATLIVLFLNFLFFSKDSTSQSPGKKIMNIKIVKKRDSNKPNLVLPFIRNLFLCLGIIEVAVILLDKNHERIGDKVTGTIVVEAG